MSSQERRLSINQERVLRQAFESLSVKFILNLPKEQKLDKVRLAYHYQKAYYYYIDELSKQLSPNYDGKIVQSKWFFDRLNGVVDRYIKKIDSEEIMKIMSKNKPTCGAIILNKKQNKVLVVQSGGKYGFPKGGKNQHETTEDCAAREVKQEVGLFIHNLINSNEKIEFLGRGEVPITYYIVRKFDENQQLKIDSNQIDDAFWMSIDLKSRIAWREFENQINIGPTLSMEQFISLYGEKDEQNNINLINSDDENPLINFKLNRERLFSVFKSITD